MDHKSILLISALISATILNYLHLLCVYYQLSLNTCSKSVDKHLQLIIIQGVARIATGRRRRRTADEGENREMRNDMNIELSNGMNKEASNGLNTGTNLVDRSTETNLIAKTIKTVLNFHETAKRVYELIAENPAKRIGWGFDGNLVATDEALPIYIWDGNINTTEEEFGGHFENSEAATKPNSVLVGCPSRGLLYKQCGF